MKKKILSMLIVVIVITCMFCGCSNEAKISLENIQTLYENNDYDSAMDEIENFRNVYAEKSPRQSDEVEKIADEIETALFEKIGEQNTAKEIQTACNTYLEYFPKGRYIDDVNSRLDEAINQIAIDDIDTAKGYIQSKDYLAADNLLQNIITNTKISKQTVGQAEELANSIAKYVTVEKAKQAIIGTWKKETGVCYTFEEDGHMSVSVPGAYNPSAGTTLDGAEVRQVVSEIENYGRPLRGGTWEYLQGEEFEKVYEEQGLLGGYSLYYDGSEFSCALKSVNGTTVMGIQLISGIGEMSFLTRVN